VQGKPDDKRVSDQFSLYVGTRDDAQVLAGKLWAWFVSEFGEKTATDLVRGAVVCCSREELPPPSSSGV
jgi:hypothetical protein